MEQIVESTLKGFLGVGGATIASLSTPSGLLQNLGFAIGGLVGILTAISVTFDICKKRKDQKRRQWIDAHHHLEQRKGK